MDPSQPSPLDHIYAAPRTASPQAASVSLRYRKRSSILLAVSLAGFLGTLLLAVLTMAAPVATLGGVVSAVLGLVGAGYSIAAVVTGAGASQGTAGMLASIGIGVGNLFMTGLGLLTAFLSTITFTRGRQIRSGGTILLPPVEAGDAWTGAGLASAGPVGIIDTADQATRDAVAAQWRENGRTEHASVAAFARLTLDLISLGAPPELVVDANRDALDEIRHTELCFGLARAIDGRVESPGAFPEAARTRSLSRSRTLALASLAVDSLVDGALHEGVSARIIAKLQRRCEAPAIQAILKEIAADEGRHARHGWDVVRWCLSEGGEPVARALEGALRGLPARMASPMPDEARDGSWERWGIMGEELEAEEHDATRVDMTRRVGQAIAASRDVTSAAAEAVAV